jgi:hypothetical protein
MKKIIENVFQIADSGCSVYLICNKRGHILIDVGMDFHQIKSIEKQALRVEDIAYRSYFFTSRIKNK